MSDGIAEPQSAPPAPPKRDNERLIVYVVLAAIGALALTRGTIDRETIIFIAVIVPSIILHEISHGAVANIFGDDTAKRLGRLTLNPIAHVDLFGTLIMPTMLALAHVPPFGYAKPVPVNLSRLRSPRNHGLLVSLAGPATNFSIAVLAAVVLRVWQPSGESLAFEVVRDAGALNVLLGTFNLIPIPPLDGSAMLERLLPRSVWPAYLRFRRYSMFLVFGIVFWFPGVLISVYEPVLDFWVRIARG